MSFDGAYYTKSVHAGTRPDEVTGAVMTPIYQTSTYAQSEPGIHKGWDYTRAGNPTRDAYEEALALLEGAKYGHAFSSGLAGEQALIQYLDPGSRIIVCDDVYGGTGRLFRRLYAKYDLDFQFVDMTKPDKVRDAITDNTKMIWVETPTNPMLKIIDIRRMVKFAQDCHATLVVDNTFASPLFQSPLALGADVVVHSTTKYIGGHSDMVGGAVMTSNPEIHDHLKFVQLAAGAVPSPFDCYLLLRSVKTLAVRMAQHEKNAQAVADFLASHPRVSRVYFPGRPEDPGHAVASEQMTGFSGMVSFEHAGTYEETVKFLQNLKIFRLAESLGGVESLVNHPERMTHASVPQTLRKKLGIGPNLVRLSVGIEDGEDLTADLKQALEA